MTDTTEKLQTEWAAIEKHYRAGVKSVRAIASMFGITEAAIRKRAKRDGWTRDSVAVERGQDRSVAVKDLVDEFSCAGFVYGVYFDAGGDRYFKVGMARSPVMRLESHQTSIPFEAKIGIAYFVNNMREEERLLHGVFAEKQVRGEWYRLSSDDLDFMASRARLV